MRYFLSILWLLCLAGYCFAATPEERIEVRNPVLTAQEFIDLRDAHPGKNMMVLHVSEGNSGLLIEQIIGAPHGRRRWRVISPLAGAKKASAYFDETSSGISYIDGEELLK